MSPDSKIKQNEKNLGLKFQKLTSVIQFEKCLQATTVIRNERNVFLSDYNF